MKAICYHGRKDVRVENVDNPKILDRRDAINKITSTAICGSDLHLYHGYMPGMQSGDVIGHEPMGDVVEVGSAVANLRRGDASSFHLPFLAEVAFFAIDIFTRSATSRAQTLIKLLRWSTEKSTLVRHHPSWFAR